MCKLVSIFERAAVQIERLDVSKKAITLKHWPEKRPEVIRMCERCLGRRWVNVATRVQQFLWIRLRGRPLGRKCALRMLPFVIAFVGSLCTFASCVKAHKFCC